jgi:CRISPR system Cascade subunit CasC
MRVTRSDPHYSRQSDGWPHIAGAWTLSNSLELSGLVGPTRRESGSLAATTDNPVEKWAMPNFITITMLRPTAGELANRDETGSAKTLIYGGATRTRVSSQAIKRRLRKSDSQHALTGGGVPDGARSRAIFRDPVFDGIVAAGVPDADAMMLAGALKKATIKASRADIEAAANAAEDVEDDVKPKARAERTGRTSQNKGSNVAPVTREDLITAQAIFLGQPEIEYLVSEAAAAYAATRKANGRADVDAAAEALANKLSSKAGTENLSAMVAGAGISTAMFGRFITSDLLARTDAAIHVAHAFTVHAQERVDDYFTAVDDLVPEGSAHLDSTELTSGLLLFSVVVDVSQLVSNLSGDVDAAAEAVRRLIMLLATQSVSAKKGSTAPYSRAQLVLIEVGNAQPRTLAAAFETPVPRGNSGWLEPAMHQLANYMAQEDAMFGVEPGALRVYASISLADLPRATRDTLAGVADAATRAMLLERQVSAVSARAAL